MTGQDEPESDGPHQGPLLCQGRLILVIRPPGPTAQPARGEPNPRLGRPRNQAPTKVLHSWRANLRLPHFSPDHVLHPCAEPEREGSGEPRRPSGRAARAGRVTGLGRGE